MSQTGGQDNPEPNITRRSLRNSQRSASATPSAPDADGSPTAPNASHPPTAPDAGQPSAGHASPVTPTTSATPVEPPASKAAWVPKALAVLTGLAFLFALATVVRANIFTGTKLAIGGGVGAVIVAVIAVFLWRTKLPGHKVRFSLLTVLAAGSAVVAVVAAQVIGATGGFLKNIQVNQGESSAIYDVVVLQSHADGIDSLKGEVVGTLPTDPNRDKAMEGLRQKVEFTNAAISDPGTLVGSLEAKHIDAALLNDSYVTGLQDEQPDIYKQLKVLYQFDVTLVRPQAASQAPAVPKGQSFIVYISGIDVSGRIDTVSRSDVNMLAVVNPETRKVLLVNTPRDYYVQLHDTTGTKDKLTHAGNFGVQKSIDTLQDLYGININYYLRVNFSSLIKVVDAVGPIEVHSDFDFTSRHGNFHFNKGNNLMNGEQALGFARERYAFAEGDRQRGIDQQYVIEALIDKYTEPSSLLKYQTIFKSLEDAIGTNMPSEQMKLLVDSQLSKPGGWSVESTSVDGEGAMLPTYSMGSMKLWVMIPNQATIDAAKAKIAAIEAGN